MNMQDYLGDQGHLVSGKVKKKHIEAGGPGGRPGQRGKNKREHGEKPIVSIKWNQQLTEQLWDLIKSKPELKRVLVNEPTRYLGPHGASGQLFSKKDLQKTIAEHLFGDGQYDLDDQLIMDNLTRAVKNKLHKTQMLYESSLRELSPEFSQYTSELEIPPELHARWGKVKDRFPTYFEYHELAKEIPAITAQMEAEAQQIGAWKAKTLSGSEDGSPNSFMSGHRRSRSVDTLGSWGLPDSPPLQATTIEDIFEVCPPPTDQNNRAIFSDSESIVVGGGGGPGHHGAPRGISPSISPGLSPVSPFHPTSPSWPQNHGEAGLPGPGLANSHAAAAAMRRSTDNLPGALVSLSNPLSGPNSRMGTLSDQGPISPFTVQPYGGGAGAGGDGLNGHSPFANNPNRPSPNSWADPTSSMAGDSQFSGVPLRSLSQEGQRLTAQNVALIGDSGVSRMGPRSRASVGGMSNGDVAQDLALGLSPHLSHMHPVDNSSASGSPDAPWSAESPREERAIETLIQVLREREQRKKQQEDNWLRYKAKRLEDREKQRIENQRQREEDEKRRLHELKMMEYQLELTRLEAENRMRSGSVPPTTGSSMASPINIPQTDSSGAYHHGDLSFNDNRVLFQPLTAPQSSQFDPTRAQTIMGISNPPAHPVSPIHVNKALHQQGPQPQQMGVLGMNQFHQSPIVGPDLQTNEAMLSQMASMGQPYQADQFGDTQLEELLRSGI